MFLLGLFTGLLYPSISDIYDDLAETLPEFVRNLIGYDTALSTPEGYFSAELFSVLIPLVMTAFAAARGAAAIAGEEQKRTLDQLLANPVSRISVVTEKTLALMLTSTFPIIMTGLSIHVSAIAVDFEVSLTGTIYMLISTVVLTWAILLMSIAAGAATGKTSVAIALPSVVVAVGILIHLLQPTAESLESLKYLSIIYYYIDPDPYVNGLTIAHAALMGGIAIISYVVAVATFRSRDLR